MNDNTYSETQRKLIKAASIISKLDLDEFTKRISHSHAAAPILNPTLYMKAMDRMDSIERMAHTGKQLKEELNKFKKIIEASGQEIEDFM